MLTRRPSENNHIRRVSQKKNNQVSFKHRRPFWLPPSNYYILASAIAIAFFFIAWWIMDDEGNDIPWVPAGFGASLILIGAVFLREVILRKARNRYLSAERQLDYNLDNVPLHFKGSQQINKLSIEENASIISNIKKKSDAAKILGRLSEAHREVFEMCDEYLILNENELKLVGIGSPRLAGLSRGKEVIRDLHRFHLFSWAEIESRTLMQEAKNRVTISEKLDTAQKALVVFDSALQYYPNETQFLESEDLVKEFVASTKVSHWIEQAERAAFKGNFKRAISHYRDALFFLARGNIQNEQKEAIAEKINGEIAKLRDISPKEKKGKHISEREN